VTTRTAVLGAGSWGTALALHLARSGKPAVLWARRVSTADALAASRENREYLPGHRLPENLEITGDLPRALGGASLVIFAAPAQESRAIFRRAAAALDPAADLVIASKGIEHDSLLRLSQVLGQEVRHAADRATVLSGPSFASEVARGDPTAVVIAGSSDAPIARVQRSLSAGPLRLYGNTDLIGVELAGALKNVIAIATGIVEGLGFGANTRAAIVTRGLAEIARLGEALGGRAATFAGLAGAGDLVLTCTGAASRNRAVGMEIGRGRRLPEILAGMRMVAEGVPTTRAAVALAERHGVDLPICRQVRSVLFDGSRPRDAVAELLSRPLKEEA
jgi:glycerol-3-phosphate dehydrogenase (NAD(P)+)